MNFQEILRASRRLSRIMIPLHGDDLTVRVSWLRAIDECENRSNRSSRKAHFHSFFEVHVMITGWNEYAMGEDTVRVEEGQLLLIRPNQLHRCVSESMGFRKYAICFSIEPGENRNEDYDFLHRTLYDQPYAWITQTPTILHGFEQTFAEILHARFGCITIVRTYVLQIIFDIARQIDSMLCQRKLSPVPQEDQWQDPRILEVRHYIRAHLPDVIRCGDVAAHMHLSVKQMDRIVRKECGQSLHDLIEEIKQSNAKEMLLESQLSIQEIAERIGFSSEFNFNRFFRRVEGMSAGQFRQARHGNVQK